MADNVSAECRSATMARVKSKDTSPELLVRRAVHAMGYGYRLHAPNLPGKPDLVFRGRKKVIFVHGCFWHRHQKRGCRLARLPTSRSEYWTTKLEGNRLRDLRNKKLLKQQGWSVLEIWECELKNGNAVTRKLSRFLGRASE